MTARLVLKRLSELENDALIGINGELIAVPGVGLALHDGGTPGGIMLEPPPQVAGSAGHNLIRNGNFIVQQNGYEWLGIPTSGDIHYIADGWHFHRGGGSTANVAISRTYTESEEDAYTALRVNTFSGGLASSYSILCQQIADARLCIGRTVTVSYKARATNPRRIAVVLRQDFDSATGTLETFAGNAELTTDWQYFTHTFRVPDTPGSYTYGAASFTGLWFWLDAGSNYDDRTGGVGNTSGQFDITNVKMEISSIATPFGATSYWDELLRVQQYFEKNTETVYMAQGGYNDGATVKTVAYIPYRVPKVKTPSISGITSSYVTSPVASGIGTIGFNVLGTANDVTSIARITGFTADAEILPY
jgi:hypothetical protein